MAGEKGEEDYAVAAAREYFAELQKSIDNVSNRSVAQEMLDGFVGSLAAIIRKHVEEYKHRHSWDCTDRECCPE